MPQYGSINSNRVGCGMDEKTSKIIKDLEKKGFKVKKVVETTKKTFEIPVELLDQFIRIVREKKMKIKEAVEQAISDWVKKNS